GRRRIFLVGLVLFTLASLACGLASSAGVLIASRAVQGLGAAIISPAALSIVTTTFDEGAERNKALGIWGALGGSGAAVGVLFGAGIFANFFILTLYVQQVLGWSALKAGLTFLATAGTVVVWAGVAQALVTRFGPRPIMTLGLLVAGGTMLYYTTLPVGGHYWPDLLPPYLTFALGLALTFVPVTIAAFVGVAPRLAGLASGLLNTSQQIGGAIGVAVASTIFTAHANSLLGSGHSFAQAYTSGYHWAFFALAMTSFVAAATGFVLLRNVRVAAGPALEPP